MPALALDALLTWYRANKRDLPWRARSDAYAVWVSEIMLQQTGVSTVIPYFERWLSRFPTVESLASADEQEVLSAWQGLGYYRRCRNLLAGARVIVERGWPQSAVEWRTIPGVGRYTAGAIASISLGEPSPLVDGNVERVYARFCGDESSGAELNRRTWRWAASEMRVEAPGDWNQALMELGATVCTPVWPKCEVCPISKSCNALQTGRVAFLPTPVPKRAVVQLAFRVSVAVCDGRFGVLQIPEGEWWAGMWEFPRFPYPDSEGDEVALPVLRHVVTHHRITLYPFFVRVSGCSEELRWFTESELAGMPMPAPQRKLLDRVLGSGLV